MKSLNLLEKYWSLIGIFWLKIVFVEGIVGGFDPGSYQFKYTVSILENNVHVCGGAILDDLHIVTAASCFMDAGVDFRNAMYSIVAGVAKTKEKDRLRIKRKVAKIFVPRIFRTFRHTDPGVLGVEEGATDIAVLRLEKSLKLSENIQMTAVSLPNAHELVSENEELIVSGFGYTTQQIIKFMSVGNTNWWSRSSTVPCNDCCEMNYIRARKISLAQCSSMHSFLIYNSQFCAQVNQEFNEVHLNGLCKGDVGNPIVRRGGILVGIFIRGPKNCNELEKAGVYTNFASHTDFVSQVMENRISRDIRTAYYKTKRNGLGIGRKVLVEA